MRKLRGGRRYYVNLRKRAEEFEFGLSEDHWYDLWHEHFDRQGYSRARPRIRRQHLIALFAAFRRALERTGRASRDVQVFVSIAPTSEAEQDALYVHTPNPNGTPFPYEPDSVRWDLPAPALLREFVDGEAWQIGAIAGGWWIVRPRDLR